jgi:hypothetical protein
MNKNIKIDLTAFAGSGIVNLTSREGKVKKCLVIPIAENYLYEGEKGIYADFIAWEMRERKENGATHLIKQSLPKDARDRMSEEEKRALPVFGDLRDAMMEKKELETYNVPGAGQRFSSSAEPSGYATTPPDVDDLPFS